MSDYLRTHGLYPTRLCHPWNFPGKSNGVGCHFLRFAFITLLSTVLYSFILTVSVLNPSILELNAMCEFVSTIVFYAFYLSCLFPASFAFHLFFPLYELIEFIFPFFIDWCRI